MATAEQMLAQLEGYLRDGSPAPTAELVRRGLAHRSTSVVAASAACAARYAMLDMVALLAEVFAKHRAGGSRTDKGCIAKRAVLRSLDRLAFDNSAWFIEASGTVQMEPVFGGTADTAADLRSEACRAMSRFAWYAVAHRLIEMTGDSVAGVRCVALNTIAAFSGREPASILLTKCVAGDSSAEVTGVCLRGLMEIDQPEGLRVASGMLSATQPDVRVEAAFALGESRLEEAFGILKQAFEQAVMSDERRTLMLAISALRCRDAAEFLRSHLDDSQLGAVAAKRSRGIRSPTRKTSPTAAHR